MELFTPLQGMSEVVKSFLQPETEDAEQSDDRSADLLCQYRR
jgi:phage terminase large subunit-like protein